MRHPPGLDGGEIHGDLAQVMDARGVGRMRLLAWLKRRFSREGTAAREKELRYLTDAEFREHAESHLHELEQFLKGRAQGRPASGTVNTKDWERWSGTSVLVDITIPGGMILKSNDYVPEGKVVWQNAEGSVIGIEDINGD